MFNLKNKPMKKSIFTLFCVSFFLVLTAFTFESFENQNHIEPNVVNCYEYTVKCGSDIWKEVQKGSSSQDAKRKLQAKYPQCRLNLSRTVKCD
tara:strand:- start:96 stop:374 length:279 start_codon:yes stop_codon:yes gene_type:complete